mgnify:CR=1 FL=1
MSSRCVTPRMKPLSARKSAILCVLDVGTTKVACLIAQLMPIEASETLRGRTHACRICSTLRLADARDAATRAYAPYSNYGVGAALLLSDGSVVTGANFENASYGLTVCAERNAIGAAGLVNDR